MEINGLQTSWKLMEAEGNHQKHEQMMESQGA